MLRCSAHSPTAWPHAGTTDSICAGIAGLEGPRVGQAGWPGSRWLGGKAQAEGRLLPRKLLSGPESQWMAPLTEEKGGKADTGTVRSLPHYSMHEGSVRTP